MVNNFKTIYALLNKKQRYGALMLFVLMLIGMFFEMLGVGLIVPLLGIMIQPNFVTEYPSILKMAAMLGADTQTKIVLLATLSIVLIYLIKNLYLMFFYWRQNLFTFSLQEKLSLRLFTAYMSQSYKFHLQRNSAQLVRNVIGEVNLVAMGANSALQLITEILVILGILVLLLLVEPYGAVVVSVILGSFAYLFLKVTKLLVLQWGEKRQLHDGLKVQHAQQGLGGVKDLILLGRQKSFIDNFQLHNKESARIISNQTLLQQIPRLWLELLAVFGVGAIVTAMLYRNLDFIKIIPVLGLFGAAIFRIMPSISKILICLQNIRFTRAAVDTVHKEILNEQYQIQDFNSDSPVQSAKKFQSSLLVNKVYYKYPNSSINALHNISFEISVGQTIGLIGASGSGKSTLVDILLGLHAPTDGEVLVDGKNIKLNLRAWQNQIGYVPQFIYLTDDTIRKNIAFGIPENEIDESLLNRAIEMSMMADFIKKLPKGVETVVGERGVRLSGGQRQRIGVARALYHDPAILVLDEATSALDTQTEAGVMEAIEALHGTKTIIIVAHRLSTVKSCDMLFRLESGKLVESGAPNQLLAY